MRVIKLASVLFSLLFILCGCYYLKRQVEGLYPPRESIDIYNQIALEDSTSAEVLGALTKPGTETELLSQSKSVIASQGMNKEGRKLWLTLVAFDENELTAKTKCFFVVDEEAESILLWPKRKLDLDIKTVLEQEVLDEPYSNENARLIAIFKEVKNGIRQDINEVAPSNNTIVICGGLINQTLATVLQKLEQSPVLASKLSSEKGLSFDHMTIGKGTITMHVMGDIAAVKVRSGAFVWGMGDPFAIQ